MVVLGRRGYQLDIVMRRGDLSRRWRVMKVNEGQAVEAHCRQNLEDINLRDGRLA
jgi:hypothetical protein